MPRSRLGQLIRSRHPAMAALRITILATAGWLALQTASNGGAKPADLSEEWPETDFTIHSVPLSEIRSGGPPKDGIPSIDEPEFVTPEAASRWLSPAEPVIAIEIDGRARAYPLQILIWHEIVNDRIGNRPIAVTFCPLCNASLVFDRRVDGTTLEFGTTGRLRKSDLVMYDRQTHSWWQQFTGRAIVGEFTGTRLEEIPARIVGFADFRESHPDGRILSRDTGYSRPYGRNPYRGYDRVGQNPFRSGEGPGSRVPAKERVLAVRIDGRHKIYPFSVLGDNPVINDRVGDHPVAVFATERRLSALDAEHMPESDSVAAAVAYSREVDNRSLTFRHTDGHIRDDETGSTWTLMGRAVDGPLEGRELKPLPGGVHFAFAWLSFRPDTAVYRRQNTD